MDQATYLFQLGVVRLFQQGASARIAFTWTWGRARSCVDKSVEIDLFKTTTLSLLATSGLQGHG